ncbi:MAG: hypothetical protein RSE09_03110 [Oscillospiraceae bacterium]
MMTCCIVGWDGARAILPGLLDCKFSYGEGTPCDSFWVKCLWPEGDKELLERATRFFVEEEGVRRFTGVVDEFSLTMDRGGATLELSGRGMAALLLDNQAEARQYQTATWSDIFSHHVAPYGIQTAGGVSLPPVNGFVAASGGSEWQVLYDFACFHGGIEPRFDAWGRLVLKKPGGGTKILDQRVAVTAMEYRARRYGVLSQILVRDRARKTVEKVRNVPFQQEGGCCQRVVTMPAKSSYRAMRYSGNYQLKKSEEDRRRLTLTVPTLFFVQVGDFVTIRRQDWQMDGVWRVVSCEIGLNGTTGGYTVFSMVPEG